MPRTKTSTRRPGRDDASSSMVPPTVDTMGIVFNNPSFLDKFVGLSHRPIRPTKFYDPLAARALGIESDMVQLFSFTNFDSFLTMHALTYKRLTLEFLSSLYVHRDENNSPRYLSFQLMNSGTIQMSVAQVNAAFGWTSDLKYGPKDGHSKHYNSGLFWRQITGKMDRDPRRDKATSIVNPAFRLSHRTFSSTIFARGDSSGVVSIRELQFIWHLTRGDGRLDMGAWLLDHLDGVARGRGDITIGGMITILAQYNGIDFSELQAIPGTTRLDMRTLRAMQWLEGTSQPDCYLWLVAGKPYAYLPDPERTVVYNKDNWIFDPDFAWHEDGGTEYVDRNPQPHQGDEQAHGGQGGDDADDDDDDEEGGPDAAQQIPAQDFAWLRQGMEDLKLEVADLRRSNEDMTSAFRDLKRSVDDMASRFPYGPGGPSS